MNSYEHESVLVLRRQVRDLETSLATERAARESAERRCIDLEFGLQSVCSRLVDVDQSNVLWEKRHGETLDRAVSAESALVAMREVIRKALESGAEDDMICSDCAQFVFRGILGEPPLTPTEPAIKAKLDGLRDALDAVQPEGKL